VVISPLQSLMKDQVDVLRQRHNLVNAVTINGLLSPLERSEAIERVLHGDVHLLYLSPESLRSRTITDLLRNRTVARIVIDEAHCFSSWGHDFRVDYLYIGEFIAQLGREKGLTEPIPVSCFTATAKPQVVQDIQAYFRDKLGLPLRVFKAPGRRHNLTYNVQPARGEAKYGRLKSLVASSDRPKIIYVSRVKTAEDLAESLTRDGLKALPYHGQMDSNQKVRNQDQFIRSEVNTIVATTAFGMGVDKNNVEMVIHYEISDSLENYVQEAGRAGRSEDIEAGCYVLFDEDDLGKHFSLLNATRLNRKEIEQIWQGIKRLTAGRQPGDPFGPRNCQGGRLGPRNAPARNPRDGGRGGPRRRRLRETRPERPPHLRQQLPRTGRATRPTNESADRRTFRERTRSTPSASSSAS
jgi:ATP-dependent DNA helicase RecQ